MQIVRWLDNERFKFESRTNEQGVGVGKGGGRGTRGDARRAKNKAQRKGWDIRDGGDELNHVHPKAKDETWTAGPRYCGITMCVCVRGIGC